MAYSPYEDVNNIVINKKKYEAAKANGGDPSVYANRAKQYYSNLEANGQGELAAQLRASDINTADAILKKYATPQSPSQSPSQSPAQSNVTSQAMSAMTQPQYKDTGATYTQNADSLSSVLSKYTQPTVAQSKSNTQGLANLQALFDLVQQNQGTINTRGNDLWNQMTQYGKDQTGRYEDLYGYIKNTDFMKTPEGQSIMANYNALGGQQAGNASARAAGSNSGNIDSYSAANANRQKLAYTNAGTSAVLNQKNSNVSNMLATLQSLGVDVGDLQNRQLGMYQGDQNYNLGLAGQYTTGQDNVGRQLQAQQDAHLNTINTGLNSLLGVNANDASTYQTGLNNAASIINTDNTNQSNLKGILDTNRTNVITNENTNAAALTQTKLQEDGKILVQEMQGKTEVEKQKMLNDYGLELQKSINEGTISAQQAEILMAQIKADADVKGDYAAAGATKYAADVAADAKKYEVDSEADSAYYEALFATDNGKNDTSNPLWGELRDQILAIRDGKSGTTGYKKVTAKEAAAILMGDSRYAAKKDLINAITNAIEDAPPDPKSVNDVLGTSPKL